jgi:protein TonB
MWKMIRNIVGWISVNTAAIVIGLGVSGALFVILPVLQFMNLHEPVIGVKTFQVANIQEVIPQREPKAKPPETKNNLLAKPQPNDAPKAMSRSRFSMDLAVGGGSGGGVAIGGRAGGDGAPQAYQEGETDADASPVRVVPPAYPEEARKAGVAGTVRCLLTIDENGSVVEVKILESPGEYGFEASIREAVAKWRYKPAEVNGIPVRQKIEQPFQF